MQNKVNTVTEERKLIDFSKINDFQAQESNLRFLGSEF